METRRGWAMCWFAALILGSVTTAHPCTLGPSPRSDDVAANFEKYDAVFVGQVIALELIESGEPFPDAGKMMPTSGMIVTFRVFRDFKDPEEPGLTLREKSRLGYPFDDVRETRFIVHSLSMPYPIGIGSYRFEIGHKYLVWASEQERDATSRLVVFKNDRPLKFPGDEANAGLAALRELVGSDAARPSAPGRSPALCKLVYGTPEEKMAAAAVLEGRQARWAVPYLLAEVRDRYEMSICEPLQGPGLPPHARKCFVLRNGKREPYVDYHAPIFQALATLSVPYSGPDRAWFENIESWIAENLPPVDQRHPLRCD